MDENRTGSQGRKRSRKANEQDHRLERLQAEFEKVANELLDLHEGTADPGTADFSIRHCSLKSKFHSIRSEIDDLLGRDQTSRSHSQAAREWERAKASAMEKGSFDKLQRLMQRLSSEDRLKGEMDEI